MSTSPREFKAFRSGRSKKDNLHASQKERVSITYKDDFAFVRGYQKFDLQKEGGIQTSTLPRKYKTLLSLLNNAPDKTSLLDVGACCGMSLLLSENAGFVEREAIEHDVEYVETMEALEKWREMPVATSIHPIHVTTTTALEKEYAMVIGLAIVHWLYSCTSSFGSLNAIVGWFAKMTKGNLLLEWVDPKDGAIKSLHHTTKSPEVHIETYSEVNFISALHRHFTKVQCVKYGHTTRRFYLCSGKMKGPWQMRRANTSTIEVAPNHSKVIKRIHKFEEKDVLKREAHWLRVLGGSPHFPKLYHVNYEKNELIMEWVGTSIGRGRLPEDWKYQLLEILAILQEKGIFYNDWRASNLCVKDGTLYLIDHQWSGSIRKDFTCGIGLKGCDKPFAKFELTELLKRLR